MKRHFLPFSLTSCAAALVLTGAAVAQLPGPPMLRGEHGPGGFGLLEFDRNADGRLTRAEFDAGQRARFDEIDANKDGSATGEEMQASFQARRARAEKDRFAALDTDKNGQLSPSEFDAGRDRGPPGGPDELRLRFRIGGGPGPGPLGGPLGGPPDGRGPRGERGLDADADGKITLAEFVSRPNEAFARADANKDGTVTIAELQALPRGPR